MRLVQEYAIVKYLQSESCFDGKMVKIQVQIQDNLYLKPCPSYETRITKEPTFLTSIRYLTFNKVFFASETSKAPVNFSFCKDCTANLYYPLLSSDFISFM